MDTAKIKQKFLPRPVFINFHYHFIFFSPKVIKENRKFEEELMKNMIEMIMIEVCRIIDQTLSLKHVNFSLLPFLLLALASNLLQLILFILLLNHYLSKSLRVCFHVVISDLVNIA